MLNARFVPVWVDIRTTPVPDVRSMDSVLRGVALDENRRVCAGFNTGFLLRSVVLTPDGGTILNPESAEWGGGHFAYAQTQAADYLPMLRSALARQSFLKPSRERGSR